MADLKFKIIADDSQLGVTLQKTTTSFTKLGDAAKKTQSEIKKGAKDSADEIDRFNKKVSAPEPLLALDKNVNSIKGLKQQIRELTNEAIKAGETSPIGQEFLKRAGQAKDRLNDLQQSVKSFGSDTKTFDGLIQGATSAAAAFSIFQGVSALVGSENKDLQKTLVKLQATTAILTGLQQIQNALQKESSLIKLKDNIVSGVTNVLNVTRAASTAFLTGQITLAAAATNVLSIATKALLGPIGIIIGVIGVLATAFALSSDTVVDNTDAMKENQKATEENEKTKRELLKTLNDLTDQEQVRNNKLSEFDAERQKIERDFADKDLELVKKQGEARDRLEQQFHEKKFASQNDFNKALEESDKQFFDNQILNEDVKNKLLGEVDDKEKQSKIHKEKETADKISKNKDESNAKYLDQLRKQREAQLKLEEDFARLLVDLEKRAFDAKVSISSPEDANDLILNRQLKELEIFKQGFIDKKRETEKSFILTAKQEEQFNLLRLQIERDFVERGLKIEEEKVKGIINIVEGAKEKLSEEKPFSFADLLGLDEKEFEKLQASVQASVQTLTSIFDEQLNQQQELLDKKKELNQEEIDSDNNKLDELRGRLDQELQLNEQGFASNVQAVQSEIAAIEAARQQALVKAKELADKQAKIDKLRRIEETVNQASNLITAAAKNFGTLPFPVALILNALMLASFAATKIQAQQTTKLAKGGQLKGRTHDEGGMPLYEAEGDEWLINKQQSRKHSKLLKAINEDRFANLKQADLMPLLKGTGVVLNMDEPAKIVKNNTIIQNATAQNIFGSGVEDRLSAMEKSMNGFFSHYKSKPETKETGNVKVTKQGSITKIIRKK